MEMTGNVRHAAFICTAICSIVAAQAEAQNLLPNPGFESGNTGFQSDYGYTSGGNCCEGQYTVGSNGNSFNGAFINPPPSSPGSVQMMVVNGSTVPNVRVWYTNIGVKPATRYRLSLRGCTAVAGGPAILQWRLAGLLIGTPTPLPVVTGQWIDVIGTWVSPQDASVVEVAVRNLNTSTFPNDFYIDDLVMEEVCTADITGEGEVDFADFLAFFNCYDTLQACGDLTGEGEVDFADFLMFFNAYDAEC